MILVNIVLAIVAFVGFYNWVMHLAKPHYEESDKLRKKDYRFPSACIALGVGISAMPFGRLGLLLTFACLGLGWFLFWVSTYF